MGTPVRFALVYPLVGALAASGCGGPLARSRAENAQLDTTVDQLRAERRRDQRRIRELENEVVLLKDRVETAELAARRNGVPSLPVEVVAPGATPPAGDVDPSLGDLGDGAKVVGVTEDGTEIVYVGDAAAGRSGTLSGDDLQPDRMNGSARPARPAPAAAPPATPPRPAKARPDPGPVPEVHESLSVARDVPRVSAVRGRPRDHDRPRSGRTRGADRDEATDATSLYQEAVAHLRAGEHASAIAQLRDLVTRFPRHDLADNALYWLGEAYYDQKDYPRAAAEFRRTVTDYPAGNKVPDAMLKLGFCYLALDQVAEARHVLEQVIAVYPKSPPAGLARKRLDALGQGGAP